MQRVASTLCRPQQNLRQHDTVDEQTLRPFLFNLRERLIMKGSISANRNFCKRTQFASNFEHLECCSGEKARRLNGLRRSGTAEAREMIWSLQLEIQGLNENFGKVEIQTLDSPL